MKQSNTAEQSVRKVAKKSKRNVPVADQPLKENSGPVTVGVDVGDKTSCYCVLDSCGEIIREGSVPSTRKGMLEAFAAAAPCRIALEVGTHSPWISRLLKECGHEVIVANARQVKLISASSRKDDRMDARLLARLARADPKLLRPIRHRSAEAQLHLTQIRARAVLVEARTSLVNAVRGLVKAYGERVPVCDADQMGVEKLKELPVSLQEALKPLLEQVSLLTEKIYEYNERIEEIARNHYPETKLLQQVTGVGILIALTFVLTIEDAGRFESSRDVGCYVGLRPKRSNSGEREPQLRITKEGDVYLRQLLVQGAHYIVSKRGPDTDLKRWGLKLAGTGDKNAKKRAVVAVARKLAVLLHRLWVTGEVYEPLRNSEQPTRAGKKAA